jgi:hypothetical protein
MLLVGDFAHHALDGAQAVFEEDLQAARLLHAQIPAQDEAQDRPRDDDQRRHHEEVGDDVARGGHRPAEGAQHRAHHGAERSIHRLDDPEFVLELFH